MRMSRWPYVLLLVATRCLYQGRQLVWKYELISGFTLASQRSFLRKTNNRLIRKYPVKNSIWRTSTVCDHREVTGTYPQLFIANDSMHFCKLLVSISCDGWADWYIDTKSWSLLNLKYIIYNAYILYRDRDACGIDMLVADTLWIMYKFTWCLCFITYILYIIWCKCICLL